MARPYIMKVTFRHYRRMRIRPGYMKMNVLMNSDDWRLLTEICKIAFVLIWHGGCEFRLLDAILMVLLYETANRDISRWVWQHSKSNNSITNSLQAAPSAIMQWFAVSRWQYNFPQQFVNNLIRKENAYCDIILVVHTTFSFTPAFCLLFIYNAHSS